MTNDNSFNYKKTNLDTYVLPAMYNTYHKFTNRMEYSRYWNKEGHSIIFNK